MALVLLLFKVIDHFDKHHQFLVRQLFFVLFLVYMEPAVKTFRLRDFVFWLGFSCLQIDVLALFVRNRSCNIFLIQLKLKLVRIALHFAFSSNDLRSKPWVSVYKTALNPWSSSLPDLLEWLLVHLATNVAQLDGFSIWFVAESFLSFLVTVVYNHLPYWEEKVNLREVTFGQKHCQLTEEAHHSFLAIHADWIPL